MTNQPAASPYQIPRKMETVPVKILVHSRQRMKINPASTRLFLRFTNGDSVHSSLKTALADPRKYPSIQGSYTILLSPSQDFLKTQSQTSSPPRTNWSHTSLTDLGFPSLETVCPTPGQSLHTVYKPSRAPSAEPPPT